MGKHFLESKCRFNLQNKSQIELQKNKEFINQDNNKEDTLKDYKKLSYSNKKIKFIYKTKEKKYKNNYKIINKVNKQYTIKSKQIIYYLLKN